MQRFDRAEEADQRVDARLARAACATSPARAPVAAARARSAALPDAGERHLARARVAPGRDARRSPARRAARDCATAPCGRGARGAASSVMRTGPSRSERAQERELGDAQARRRHRVVVELRERARRAAQAAAHAGGGRGGSRCGSSGIGAYARKLRVYAPFAAAATSGAAQRPQVQRLEVAREARGVHQRRGEHSRPELARRRARHAASRARRTLRSTYCAGVCATSSARPSEETMLARRARRSGRRARRRAARPSTARRTWLCRRCRASCRARCRPARAPRSSRGWAAVAGASRRSRATPAGGRTHGRRSRFEIRTAQRTAGQRSPAGASQARSRSVTPTSIDPRSHVGRD